ncbi:MAG: hypothetical protein AAF447_08400 [Myxococcota bacterium]
MPLDLGPLGPVEVPDAVSVETAAPEEVVAGATFMPTCTILDAEGEAFSTMGRTPSFRVSPESSVSVNGLELTARIAGEVEVGCRFRPLMLADPTPSRVRIVPGPATELETRLDRSVLVAGEALSARCEAFDAYGNRTSAEGASLRVTPDDAGTTSEGLSATLTRAGAYLGACDLDGAAGIAVPFEVRPGLPASLALAVSPTRSVYGIGEVMDLETIVTDAFGNVVRGAALVIEAPAEAERFGVRGLRFLEEGTFTLAVSVAGPTAGDVVLREEVEVVVNGNGPTIRCDDPMDGGVLDAAPGSTVTLRGTVSDAAGVDAVSVDGVPAVIGADGRFEGDVIVRYGMNFVDVVGVDGLGEESAETCTFLATNRWEDPEGLTNDVLTLALADEGIDDGDRSGAPNSLADLLAQVLDGPSLAALLDTALTAVNPLKASSCDVRIPLIGCIFRSSVSYTPGSTRATAGPVSLDLVPGGLRLRGEFRNVRLGLRVGGTVSTSGTIGFSRVGLDAVFDVAVVDGVLQVSSRSTAIDLAGLDVDFSGLAGALADVLDFLAGGLIEGLLEGVLEGLVGGAVGPLLDGVLGGLDFSDFLDLEIPRFGAPGTVALSGGGSISSVDITPERLRLGVATRVSAPASVALPIPGVPFPPPPDASLLAEPVTDGSLAAAIHPGLINQLLFAVWRGGLLEGSLDVGSLGGGEGGGLLDGASVGFRAGLPPIADVTGEGDLRIELGALDVDLTLPGLLDEPLALRVGGRLSTTPIVTDGVLDIGEPVVEELVFSSGEIVLDAATRDAVEAALGRLLSALVLDQLLALIPELAIPAFPLPDDVGSALGLPPGSALGVSVPALDVDPPHLVLSGNLGVL